MRVSSHDTYFDCNALLCVYDFMFLQTLGIFFYFLSVCNIRSILFFYYFFITINILQKDNIDLYMEQKNNIACLVL